MKGNARNEMRGKGAYDLESNNFQQEVRKVQKLLFRIAWAYMGNLQDVEDMVQDAIMIAWSKRNTLRDAKQFSAWIARILANQCKNTLRRRKILSFFPLEEDKAVTDELPVEAPVREAMKKLKPETQLLITLYYDDGYTMKEIAEILGVPLGTVQTRLMRARKRLKEILLIEWEGE